MGKSRYIYVSVNFGSNVYLHLHMSQVLFWNLTCEICNHHIKNSEIPVELPCCLYQGLPVRQAFVDSVFVYFVVDLFEFNVESKDEFFKFWYIRDLIPQLCKFVLYFFEEKISE